MNNSMAEANVSINLHYWREGNNEVDFILEKRDKVTGLEVKSGASTDNEGMGIFNEKFHPDKMLLIGAGGIPYEEFFKINPKDIF
jgi:predicted AAA+ superfamily ATPase